MATLNQRLAALEQRADQGEENFVVIFCQGNTPTPEERDEAKEHERVMFVTFHKGQEANHGNA